MNLRFPDIKMRTKFMYTDLSARNFFFPSAQGLQLFTCRLVIILLYNPFEIIYLSKRPNKANV